MSQCRLEIDTHGPGRGRVLLDGHDISNVTAAIALDLGAGRLTRAEITVHVGELVLGDDVDAKIIKAEGKERTSFTSRFREWVK